MHLWIYFLLGLYVTLGVHTGMLLLLSAPEEVDWADAGAAILGGLLWPITWVIAVYHAGRS